jgi:hypothetical protein
MFTLIIQGDLGIFRRGVNIQGMFAPIIQGDLGIFRTVAEFGRSEVLSYRDNLSIQSHDECLRSNTEVTQGQDPRVLGVDFIPNTFFSLKFSSTLFNLHTPLDLSHLITTLACCRAAQVSLSLSLSFSHIKGNI